MNVTNYTGNHTGAFLATPTGTSGDIFILVIVLILSARVYRGRNGTKFSMYRVIGMPILYLLLTVGTVFYSNMTYAEYTIAAVAFVIGTLLGTMLGKETRFFDKDERLYYKRSTVVISVWLVSYVFRDILPILFTGIPLVIIAANIALALTTGMLIGESVHIYREYKRQEEKAIKI